MTANAPVLEAAGLHRFFRSSSDEVAALLDISFAVAPGEVVAVRGPSGSGKSTLLSILGCVDRPDAGEVRLDGVPVNYRGAGDSAGQRRTSIGLLPQAGGLLPHLRVKDNIRVTAAVRRRRCDVDQLLDQVGLLERRDAWPTQLSGGETARAGLATALVGEPRVLLADEPTAEVSSAEERALLELIRATTRTSAATILVTHSDVVAAAADRVLHLSEGRLVAAPERVAALEPAAGADR